jgi:hypothetical protein
VRKCKDVSFGSAGDGQIPLLAEPSQAYQTLNQRFSIV